MSRRKLLLGLAGAPFILTGCEAPAALTASAVDTPVIDKSGRPDTRVEVSLQKQTLIQYKDNSIAMRMRAIVGSPERPTPILKDRISSIKFAPEWNPPKTILERDLYPELRRDPRFVYNGWTVYQGGKKINPRSIDWKTADLKSYRFVQDSGFKNALGSLRFTMHNNQAIFIHDTPFKSGFGAAERYASSGCIRAEQAGRLAAWMLRNDGQAITTAEIRELKKGPTKIVPLKKSMPVFVDAA